MTRTSSQCVDQTGIVRPCASRWNFVGRHGRPTLCITFKETKKWTSAADNCKKARRDARPTFGLSYAGCAQTGGGLEEFGYIHSCGVCSVRGCKSCWHSFVFPQCLGSTITESFLSQQASKHTATCQVHQRGFESPNGSRHSASATFICINRWTEVMKLHGAYQQWLSLAFSLSYKEKGVVWLSERRYSGLSFLFFHTFMWYCICKKNKKKTDHDFSNSDPQTEGQMTDSIHELRQNRMEQAEHKHQQRHSSVSKACSQGLYRHSYRLKTARTLKA